jgi:hypothetical protein
MSTPPITITLIRRPSRDAGPLLDQFVNGGREAGRRAPRGIDPAFVSFWIRENIKPDCAPASMMRVGDLLRFYERKDVLDHISRFLTRNESEERDFRRAMYILQAIGEAGTPEQTTFAVRYHNEFLLPLPVAMEFFTLVLETAEVLATAIDVPLIGRRLQAAIDAAGVPKNPDSPAAIPFLKYSDYRVNNYPSAARTIEAKRRLSTIDPAQRLQELLFIYLGESPLSTPSMHVWAGRLIRRHAMNDAQTPVLAAFTQILDGAIKSQMPKPKKDFLIHRAAQAIIYLRGKLSFPQEAAYEAIKTGPENFLWDDQ